jgi:hypothetical protein
MAELHFFRQTRGEADLPSPATAIEVLDGVQEGQLALFTSDRVLLLNRDTNEVSVGIDTAEGVSSTLFTRIEQTKRNIIACDGEIVDVYDGDVLPHTIAHTQSSNTILPSHTFDFELRVEETQILLNAIQQQAHSLESSRAIELLSEGDVVVSLSSILETRPLPSVLKVTLDVALFCELHKALSGVVRPVLAKMGTQRTL